MGKVLAVCMSEQRGVAKKDVASGCFKENWGLDGDGHAGPWHRQVSLLSADKVQKFNESGANVRHGDFGENLVVEGIDFRALPVGTLLRSGNVLLEITQIGKQCHTHCQIYHRMGDCIMPREGVFARVLKGGEIAVGDDMTIEARTAPMPWRAAVITLSDKGAAGERKDKSGPAIAAQLRENGYEIVRELLLPDDKEKLETALMDICDRMKPDLILTTGGTGFSTYYARSHTRRSRKARRRHSRSYPCGQPAHYSARHAFAGRSRNPWRHADRQPARKPEGVHGEYERIFRRHPARDGAAARRGAGVR